jgi:hypothetical protein
MLEQIERTPKSPILKARKVNFEEILFDVEQHDPRKMNQFQGVGFGGQLATAIYAPTLNKVLHFGGSMYQLISNDELMTPIYEKLVKIFGENGFRVQCWNEDDRRFSTQFILNDRTIEVANKDMVNAMIEIQNSYDGTLRHSIGLSFYRQICTNGLMGWRREEPENKAKHFSGYIPNLEKIIKRLDNLDYQLKQFRKMSERQVTQQEIHDLTVKFREQTTHNFPKKLIDIAVERIGNEADIAGAEQNAWIVYNSFNRILNHDDRIGLAMDKIERIDHNILSTLSKELSLELVLN